MTINGRWSNRAKGLFALLFCPPAFAASLATPPSAELLPMAVNQLYDSHFDESRRMLAAYSSHHPDDPLAYSRSFRLSVC